jgi:hypothetical protein
MSLSLGRPPSLSLAHVDTKPPTYAESTHVPKDENLCAPCPPRPLVLHLTDFASDHEWKNALFVKCLAPILEAVAAVSPPEYKEVLGLDARVRDFHAPAALTDSGATARFLVMQRALVASGRDIGAFPLSPTG